MIREIRNIFEHGDKYYKPIRAGYFCSNNYIEYKSKGDRKTLSVEEYLNKIKTYLFKTYHIWSYDLKKSDTDKIQLKVTINFVSSKDNNDVGHVMH